MSTDCDAPAVAHSIIGRMLPFQVRAGQATLSMAWGALHGTTVDAYMVDFQACQIHIVGAHQTPQIIILRVFLVEKAQKFRLRRAQGPPASQGGRVRPIGKRAADLDPLEKKCVLQLVLPRPRSRTAVLYM